jgi:hypothetical protein
MCTCTSQDAFLVNLFVKLPSCTLISATFSSKDFSFWMIYLLSDDPPYNAGYNPLHNPVRIILILLHIFSAHGCRCTSSSTNGEGTGDSEKSSIEQGK